MLTNCVCTLCRTECNLLRLQAIQLALVFCPNSTPLNETPPDEWHTLVRVTDRVAERMASSLTVIGILLIHAVGLHYRLLMLDTNCSRHTLTNPRLPVYGHVHTI